MSDDDLYYVPCGMYERVCDELDKIKREWIDPQRIVELAKRYTDEGKPGWVELTFWDNDPDYTRPWTLNVPGMFQQHEGKTAIEALNSAESS